MDPDTARVAMLHQDPHPAHRGFAETVGADLVDYQQRSAGPLDGTIVGDVYNGIRYPDYDIYIVEGSKPLYAALSWRFASGGKIVYLGADHGLFQLGNANFEGSSTFKSLIGRFGQPMVRTMARRGIDGVVAVSEFVEEFTRRIVGQETPIEVAHPFIQPGTYESLAPVEPALGANVAVTVARPWRYKGVDLLVDAWPDVRSEFPDAELHVVGRGHPTEYSDVPGVTVRGYVDDLEDAFRPASLFVQPSRVDAFPVSTLEAMRAGLPPLVTETTGTRSEARAIHDSLVVAPTPDALSSGVQQYFSRERTDRESFSERARTRGAQFDAETRTAAFRDAFREVLKAL